MKRSKAKAPYKLWGGRFETSASNKLQIFSNSLAFDYRLAQADILGTKAYAAALERAGILSRTELARAAKALDTLAREIAASDEEYFSRAAEEDIHSFI